ncbi:hypothetical protein AVEN_273891-1 [Araneus ventricosus]|uniref:Uncharacterized protein n=1 Tax=Araneus ventricosus TaxID=182803 RepID=A0A4Y2SAU3_ARAVE|nr:hypothetical protein AVEN_273891-1 [Araneus ventricosus]
MYLYSVLAYEEASAKLRTRMVEKSAKHWLPHMPRHCENTFRGIVKCRANSTATAIIAVREVKTFQAGRERIRYYTVAGKKGVTQHYSAIVHWRLKRKVSIFRK